MAEKKDEKTAAEVAQQIDSLRQKAAEGELGDELLEEVAGGAMHTNGDIHTNGWRDGIHTDGVIHTDSAKPNET
jgi:hypothetical protein